jgi:hypothetical protein
MRNFSLPQADLNLRAGQWYLSTPAAVVADTENAWVVVFPSGAQFSDASTFSDAEMPQIRFLTEIRFFFTHL